MDAKQKRLMFLVFKLAIVGGLLGWLVQSGRLDFRELRVFYDEPRVFIFNFLVWLLFYVLCGALRWYTLLRGLDLHVTFWRVVRLQMIGFFFNTAMPGAVGGDIVKAFYVIREQQQNAKTPALLTVLLDRIIGLAGLFILAGVAVAIGDQWALEKPEMQPLVAFVGLGIVGVVAGAIVIFIPFKPGRDPFARLLEAKRFGIPTLLKIYEALRGYRSKPRVLLTALAISCVIHVASLTFAYYVTQVVAGFDPDFWTFALIYPLGLMTTALPLAPGGLGVGHVAFDKLFAMVGWSGGANVFNILVLGQLALHLLGFIPYLLHRTRLPSAEEVGDVMNASVPIVK